MNDDRERHEGAQARRHEGPEARGHHSRRRWGRVNPAMMIVGASVIAVAVLVALLAWPDKSTNQHGGQALVLYCAAGIKPPVEEIAREYEKTYGVAVQIQYGGSGTLLGSIQLYKTGDLFLAADQSYIDLARSKGLMAEVIPLAQQTPVIAVRKGNPKKIAKLDDLLRDDVKVSLANPDAASIGNIVKKQLAAMGRWKEFESRIRTRGVFKPTVNDTANDVKLGAADATIVWDATVKMYPDLETAVSPAFEHSTQLVSIGVLNATKQPTAALRFARFLGASDKGLKAFERHGFVVEEGDQWAVTPEIRLMSGAMLRPGIEKTLKEFEAREGVRFTTIYNGCGVLTSQMKAGDRPDAYFSCDTSFMDTVADMYLSPLTISDNDIMIIVPKGNPKGIKAVSDLTRPDLRVGVASPEKSAFGALTRRMLVAMNLYDQIKPKVESPTGDMLVNSLRTGSLDVIIACRSNAKTAAEHLDAIPIDHPMSKAAQPYAVGKASKHKQLMARLQDAFTSATSKERFLSAGFGWKAPDKER